ncbi:hypothetical protein C8035_v006676 [Colletotrichum spinosum]|uniref:Uncharacterized protein n=1 Tax=Colletotrichum spinosum TaxID=1347390 RepID=A0A4R8PR87_9PEZI|nr:hypothetical protein C8035_v006676 [Colletotrichum spinosum]
MACSAVEHRSTLRSTFVEGHCILDRSPLALVESRVLGSSEDNTTPISKCPFRTLQPATHRVPPPPHHASRFTLHASHPTARPIPIQTSRCRPHCMQLNTVLCPVCPSHRAHSRRAHRPFRPAFLIRSPSRVPFSALFRASRAFHGTLSISAPWKHCFRPCARFA